MRYVYILSGNSKEKVTNKPFEDEVKEMQPFFKENISVLGDNLKFVAEKVRIPFGGSYREIDILAIEERGNSFIPVVIELKKNIADENVLLQVLRYASWVANNPDSVKYLLTQAGFDKNTIEKVNFDNVQIIIVAASFKNILLSLSQYLTSKFQISFVKYGRYVRENKPEEIITIEYISPPAETSGAVKYPKESDFETYLSQYANEGVREEYLENIKKAYDIIQQIIEENGWDISPALNKWYIAFQIKGPISNIFEIRIRKTMPPILAIRLGEDFKPESIGINSEDFKKNFRMDTYGGFWITEIKNPESIVSHQKLLQLSYEKYATT